MKYLLLLLMCGAACCTLRAQTAPVTTASGPTTFCAGGSVTLTVPATGDKWVRKADYIGAVQSSAVSFSIGNKGYLGTGLDNNGQAAKDFWEYNPVSDVWTQKEDFGGQGTYNASGFSIGSYGYIFTGFYSTDFWQYDPALNHWTRKADIPGSSRLGAAGFSIGDTGYIGLGVNGSISGITYLKDFYRYSPASDTWSALPVFPGNAREEAVGFSIGSNGYVGTGSNLTDLTLKDFWQYSPATGNWVRKADFGGGATGSSAGFSVGNKGYIGMYNQKDFWEYNPDADNWVRKTDYPGNGNIFKTGFGLDGRGYMGVGGGSTQKDFWQYTPSPSFTYKWSTGETTQSITVSTPGSYYVITTNPTTNKSDTSAPVVVTVNTPDATITASRAGNICKGDSVTLSLPADTVNHWTRKANFGGVARSYAVSFSIGGKGYFGTGTSPASRQDFWQYDTAAGGVWTQVADFGGGTRAYAVGFSILNYGYAGTGIDANGTYAADLWQYNPAANQWVRKADFPGTGRAKAVGLSINNNGYIGTGTGTGNVVFNDFYTYNPATDAWSPVAPFPGAARYDAAGFSIGNYGYAGTGRTDLNTGTKDFYKYDPSANSWTSVADCGAVTRYGATGFGIGMKGYIVGGSLSNTVLEYNPANNVWVARADYPGASGIFATGFSIGNYGYVGTGQQGLNYQKDFWQYNPGNTYLWNTGDTTVSITVKTAGNYTVTVTNPFGCTASAKDSVTVDSVATPYITVVNNCGSSVLSTDSKDNLRWSTGETASAITVKTSGVYSVTATGNSGCSDSSSVAVAVNQPPSAKVTISGPTTFCSGDSVKLSAPAGNVWVQKADLGDASTPGRYYAVGFSNNGKGYVGTGYSYTASADYKDFWAYDTASEAWTKLNNYPAGDIGSAVGFSVGNTGYIGTGLSYGAQKKDFWAYDIGSNNWSPVADFGGSSRDAAVGFSIGNMGYVGTGTSRSSTKDFWAYNPKNNVWTQKADFAGNERYMATGFSIGNTGYIGTGSYTNDFWAYDPRANSWTRKADIPPAGRKQAVGFSINNIGYLGLGYTNGGNEVDFYEYNPANDTWIRKADYPGKGVFSDIGFGIGSYGYVGTGAGYGANGYGESKDFWQYTPGRTYLWNTGDTLRTITIKTSGKYYVTVTDSATGCSKTSDTIVVTASKALTPVVTVMDSCGKSTLSTTAAGSLMWSTGATSSSISVTQPGKYYVMQNLNGCASDTGFATASPKAIPPAPGVTVMNNCGSSTLTATSYNGSLLWSTGSASQQITVTAAGKYYVTQTVSGCTSAKDSGTAAPVAASQWVLDADGDKYYTGGIVNSCTSPGSSYVLKDGTIKGSGDCNDANKNINPGMTEVCGNGIDDNCNGQVDEGCSVYTYYQDYDKDGYGNPKVTQTTNSSTPPQGYVSNNLDCNDRNAKVHPGAYDGYDGIDNDCDGQIDEDYFQLSICDARMYEGNSGQCYLYFTVSLNWIPCRTISVNYTTKDGTATTANKDYTAKSGKLTFPLGVIVQTIAIPVIGDKVKEADETFRVILSSPYNATLYKGTGTGTILNDDKSTGSSSLIAENSISSLQTDAELSVKLNPVPARNNMMVSMNGFTGKILLQVFNADGKQVKQQTTTGSLQQMVDVSNLAASNYLLIVSDEKGNRKTEKFMVSR